MENTILTTEQKEILQGYIQTEMLKRGLHAKIISFEEVIKGRNNHIEFETEKFQTVPVIFKSITVENFSTSVKQEEVEREDKSKYLQKSVWITVSTRTQSFSGGANVNTLFSFNCNFVNDFYYMFDVAIR